MALFCRADRAKLMSEVLGRTDVNTDMPARPSLTRSGRGGPVTNSLECALIVVGSDLAVHWSVASRPRLK